MHRYLCAFSSPLIAPPLLFSYPCLLLLVIGPDLSVQPKGFYSFSVCESLCCCHIPELCWGQTTDFMFQKYHWHVESLQLVIWGQLSSRTSRKCFCKLCHSHCHVSSQPSNLLGYMVSEMQNMLVENFTGHLILFPQFTDNETEIWRRKVKCLRSHSWLDDL